MKKLISQLFLAIKERVIVIGIGYIYLLLAALISLPFYIKFKVWEVQHPDAPTWTFFLPRGK